MLPHHILAGTAPDRGSWGSAWLGWETFWSAYIDLCCSKPSLRLPGLIVAARDRRGLAVDGGNYPGQSLPVPCGRGPGVAMLVGKGWIMLENRSEKTVFHNYIYYLRNS